VLPSTGFGEESVEGIVASANGLIAWHLAIRLDAVLQAEEFPASIPDLHACLANVDADGLTHGCKKELEVKG